MKILKQKLRIGRYLYPITFIYYSDRIFLIFGYNKALISEIKAMGSQKYHGFDNNVPEEVFKITNTHKVWSIANNPRNNFQINFMTGGNPYEHYEKSLIDININRPVYEHQHDGVRFILTRKHCIIASEQGTGKTLMAIETMERSQIDNWWWVAPKSPLRAAEREFNYWESKIRPETMTYERLVKVMKNFQGKPPKGIVFDESARTKTPTAQRSEAARKISDLIREHYGLDSFIILMSGAPAPRSPADWWNQCEIACPGFIREGSHKSFMLRLGAFENVESITGGVFKQRITWYDDEKKCAKCGEFKTDIIHDSSMLESHEFKPSVDEVSKLYRRLDGLVFIRFKKDCLDLPDKIYNTINLKPKPDILRAAKLIAARASNAATALILLRQLSDGFQYVDEVSGTKFCQLCMGSGQIEDFICDDDPQRGESGEIEYHREIIKCHKCDGTGKEDRIIRGVDEIDTPKESVFIDILDEHSEIGRIVAYAGFQASIDRMEKICHAQGWDTIKVDGRGWSFTDRQDNIQSIDPLEAFQNKFEKYPRLAFIGQPGAAGEGLTLTASPTIIYWSNDFNANSRIQSEDRIHRIGMDLNKGATIIDLCHLDTDRLIIDNLKQKRRLQSLSLGEIQKTLEDKVSVLF